jgi:hypothetical protein
MISLIGIISRLKAIINNRIIGSFNKILVSNHKTIY